MELVFYTDVIFVYNFFVDFILLCIIFRLCHENCRIQKKQWLGLFAGAVLGGMQAVLYPVILFYMTSFFCFLFRIIGALMISKLAFHNRSLSEWFCDTALFIGAGAVVAGIYHLVRAYLPKKQSLVPWMILIITCIVFLFMGLILHKRRMARQELYHYRIVLKNHDEIVPATALFDSGNRLYEPISGKPVMLLSKELLQKLHPDITTFRIIPYTSVGKSRGTLTAYLLDEIQVDKNSKNLMIKEVYAAAAEEVLCKKGDYEAILHPDLFIHEETKKETKQIC